MKVFVIAAVSADGKIAESTDQNSTDWTSKEDLAFFVKKTKEAGAMIMGRTTFETIGRPLPGRLMKVMTSTPEAFEDIPGELEFTNLPPEEILGELEGRGFEQVAITGGSRVYTLFLNAGLVDELFLTVEPVIFGSGIPLVGDGARIDLDLVASEMLNKQTKMMHYKVVKRS